MNSMAFRGRAFAAAALLMVVAQVFAVCAVPLAACALSPSAVHHERVECCPAGSHPPGQCPLHKTPSHSNECRMTCARQGATPFVPGVVGVLLPSIAMANPAGGTLPVPALDSVPCSRSSIPSSPPPKPIA